MHWCSVDHRWLGSTRLGTWFYAGLVATSLSFGQAITPAVPGSEEVLLENKWAKITRADFDTELLRLSPDLRGGFATNQRRINQLLARLLESRTLAVQAREAGLDKDPETQRRLALEIDKLYAGLQIARVEQDADKAFSARQSQLEARARELYLVDRDKYKFGEQVSASHILFDIKKHSKDEALKLAQQARAKIAAGANFSEVAKQVSEDPTAPMNAGFLNFFSKEEMDPSFSDAAFNLKNIGDVSDPVLSRFGYHLIRLDGRKPGGQRTFDEVKDVIMGELRQKFINDERDLFLGSIRSDPSFKANQKAVDALRIPVPPSLQQKAPSS